MMSDPRRKVALRRHLGRGNGSSKGTPIVLFSFGDGRADTIPRILGSDARYSGSEFIPI